MKYKIFAFGYKKFFKSLKKQLIICKSVSYDSDLLVESIVESIEDAKVELGVTSKAQHKLYDEKYGSDGWEIEWVDEPNTIPMLKLFLDNSISEKVSVSKDNDFAIKLKNSLEITLVEFGMNNYAFFIPKDDNSVISVIHIRPKTLVDHLEFMGALIESLKSMADEFIGKVSDEIMEYQMTKILADLETHAWSLNGMTYIAQDLEDCIDDEDIDEEDFPEDFPEELGH